ncbi:unnamed protein product [Prunus armeniaca]
MEWLVYCIVLSTGFHSQLSKGLLPPYYDVPQVLDSIRYRLFRDIGQFSFGLNPIPIGPQNWAIQVRSYTVCSEMEWLVYCIVLSIGFHSQLSKRLPAPYYAVP